MLQALIHRESAEDHQEKKQIVDAESFFDQVAGKEFQAQLGPAEIEHSEPKENGNRNPAETGDGRVANLNLVRAAVKNAQVQRNRCHDEEIERNPVKGRSHGGSRALGSGSARVERVQIRQFDAGGLAAFNFYRNVPPHAHISRVGVQIE